MFFCVNLEGVLVGMISGKEKSVVGVWPWSAAFSCTIYQLKRDEMSSEAASTRSEHNLEVVLGLWPIFHGAASSSISLLLSRRSAASGKKKKNQ